MSKQQTLFAILQLLLLVIASWLILSQGIHNQQLLDDTVNFAPLKQIAESPDRETIQRIIFGNRSGPLGRPLSMASFALDAQAWPLDIARIVKHNILLHIAAGLGLLWFSFLLFIRIQVPVARSFLMAVLVTTIWLFHPLLVSTYLYSVQRMTVLAGLLTMLSLIAYLKLRPAFYSDGFTRPIAAVFLLAIPITLALAAKENSFVIFSLIGLVEIFIITHLAQSINFVRKAILSLALFSTPISLVCWALYNQEKYLISSQLRGFNLSERLLTESRILFDYIYSAFIPKLSGSGIFQDDILISRGLFTPFTTIISVIAIISLITLSTIQFKKYPIAAFAFLWFLIAHLIEGSVIPLELKFEHRNYVPLAGLIFGAVLLTEKCSTNKWRLYIVGLFAFICVAITSMSVLRWSKPLFQAEIWRNDNPASSRASQHAASLWLSNGFLEQALNTVEASLANHPNNVTLNIQFLYMNCRNNEFTIEDLSRIEEPLSNGVVDYAIPSTLKLLGHYVSRGSCEGLTLEMLLSSLTNLIKNPRLAVNKKLNAETYYSVAELYSYTNDYITAAKYSSVAFDSYEDGKYALTEAICWINSRMPEKALEALEKRSSLIETESDQVKEINNLYATIKKMRLK